MARDRIVYADCDRLRLATVTTVLTCAGYAVWPCSGEEPLLSADSFAAPDLVLLCGALDERLRALAGTLWPKTPTLVLKEPENDQQLAVRVASTLRKCQE